MQTKSLRLSPVSGLAGYRPASEPTSVLVAVNAQEHLRNAWGVLNGMVQHQEIRSHLRDRHGMSIQEQSHSHVR